MSKARPVGHKLSIGLVESAKKKKSVLFARERRAFRVNKPEKWQTLYNEELPEKTHSAPELNLKNKLGVEKVGGQNMNSLRNKNMTECEGGTTGFFVGLSINLKNILGLNYARLSRYNLDEHISAVFHWINKSAVCHFVFVHHACPCRVSEQASPPKRLWRCLTWKAYSLQKEIQANGLFVLLPKGLLCKPGGEWWLKQRDKRGRRGEWEPEHLCSNQEDWKYVI